MDFTLEALQANDGDCLMLHYRPSSAAKMTRVLIDGGAGDAYETALRPRIDELRGGGRLDLRMMMLSHIDRDHITGLLDLCRALKKEEDAGADPACRIRTLWFNAFERLNEGHEAGAQSAAVGASMHGAVPAGVDDFAGAVVASVKEGNDLLHLAKGLAIVLNQELDGDLVMAPETGTKKVKIAEGLIFTILGPHKKQLDNLDKEWQKSKDTHPADPAAQAADYLNRTVPNLSSIVVLAEAERGAGQPPLRMLLTGDAGGDHIITSLTVAGLIGPDGKCRVDLLKVMHHGSNHSVDQKFFETVLADHYVISGNGKHDIPHEDTLGWLSAARKNDTIDVYMTNRKGVLGLKGMLDTFLASEQQFPHHRYHFRDEAALSISVPLA